MEIPKPLQLADVAVRVMWPPYDPLTRQAERLSDSADKRAPDGVDTAEKLSTIADTVESAQLENNEVCTYVTVCNHAYKSAITTGFYLQIQLHTLSIFSLVNYVTNKYKTCIIYKYPLCQFCIPTYVRI